MDQELLIINNLGRKSDFFREIKTRLFELYLPLQNEFREFRESWETMYSNIYNKDISKPDIDIFIEHCYLLLVIEQLVLQIFTTNRIPIKKVEKLIILDHFLLKSNPDLYFAKWIQSPLISEEILIILNLIKKILSRIDLNRINSDVFRIFYENIIFKTNRHTLGEYYTPDWLSTEICSKVLSNWFSLHPNKFPRIFDPACGSGVFFSTIMRLGVEEYKFSPVSVISCLRGFDINPIALNLARANVLATLGKNIFDLIENDLTNSIDPFEFKDILNLNLESKKETRKKIEDKSYDIIIGNPPWIVLHSINDLNRQENMKKAIFKYNLLSKNAVHLFTQIDLATIIFCKVSDLLLRNKGIIAFIMPKSVVVGTETHNQFRKLKYPLVELTEIWDLQKIKPLFGIPACVLFGQKGRLTKYPLSIKIFNELDVQSLDENNIKKNLSHFEDSYYPPENSQQKSWYYDRFHVGASIFPRNLYFVDKFFQKTNTNLISAKTAPDIIRISKKNWKNVKISGLIDSDFVFKTILALNIVPFGITKVRDVVLPIKINDSTLKFMDIHEIITKEMKFWFTETDRLWKLHQTKKSRKNFPNLTDRLNYNNLLLKQDLKKKFICLYSGTGSNICACVINRFSHPLLKDGKDHLILDVKTWYFSTDSESEAYYLGTILNSQYLNNLIKPLQPQGLGGARAIHRRPFQFPISKFNEFDGTHIKLSKIGKNLSEKVISLIKQNNNISRKDVRKQISGELKTVDRILKTLL